MSLSSPTLVPAPAPAPAPLRVLMVLNRFHPMVGGAERQCQQLMARLPVHRVQADTVVTHRYSTALAPAESLHGVFIRRLGRPTVRAGIAPLAFYADLVLFLIRNIGRYDVLHCHTAGFTGLLTAVVGRFGRRPVVLKLTAEGEIAQQTVRTDTAGWKAKIRGFLRRALARLALCTSNTQVVALTPSGAEECARAGSCRVTVIPNGVDTGHFSPVPGEGPRRGSCDRSVTFGYAGRLTAEKGTDTLAAVFEKALKDSDRSIRLRIVGSAELQLSPSTRQLAALEAAFAGRVSVEPAVPDTLTFLREIDCYFSASTYEGMPNAVLEALACGLPCILSDIDAHRELKRLNPQAHIDLFDPGNVAEAVAAVVRLAGMHPAPRSALSSAFRLDTVAMRYAGLYDLLTGRSIAAAAPP